MVAVRKAPSTSSEMERIFSTSALVSTGWMHFQPLVRAGIAAQQIGTRPDHRHQAHHQFFADRIDRRIGDLGEILLEIIVEQLGLLRQHRDAACPRPWSRSDRRPRSPSAPGRTGDLPGCSQRPAAYRAAAKDRWPWRGDLPAGRAGLPACTGPPSAIPHKARRRRTSVLISSSSTMRPSSKSISSILPGCSRHLRLIFSSGTGMHAGFRRQDHQIVVGDDIARGTQAVAVQGGADLAAVGEGDGGGAVPRLHQRGMIFVESLALGIHASCCRPRLPGSASSPHGPADSRRPPAAPAHCRGRRCRTGRAESAATSCPDRGPAVRIPWCGGAHSSS